MSKIRRLVASRMNGLSSISDDRLFEFAPFAPSVNISDLWQIAEGPINLDDPFSGSAPPVLMPGPGQVVMRIVQFQPGDVTSKSDENEQLADASGIDINGNLHRTRTLDYAVVRQGELWLVTEDGEVHLTAGDVVILLGGFHSWENRSAVSAEIFSVMIGASAVGAPSVHGIGEAHAQDTDEPRRVIAGHNHAGKSAILSTMASHDAITVDPFTKVRVFWHERLAPPDNSVPDTLKDPVEFVAPQDTGSSFWKVEIAPGNQPTLREHDTLDFVLVTDGELSYVTEAGETVLRTGDVLVQSGNKHGWRNHTSQSASVAVVHIGSQTSVER